MVCLRGITFILQAILFRVVPTALEISLVCGILVRYGMECLFQVLIYLCRRINLDGITPQLLSARWQRILGLPLKPLHGGMSFYYTGSLPILKTDSLIWRVV